MRILGLLLLSLLQLTESRKPSNAILLSTVKSLTLRGDQLTSARRVKAIPQLKCIGGNAKGLYHVDVMRCKNTGSEYGAEDISWTCQANLPADFKLGSTDVICEGYDSPDDPYVLKGSCGVEYRLLLTDLGEEKYGGRRKARYSGSDDEPSTIYTLFFWLVFLGIIGFFVYKIFIEGTGVQRNVNRGFRRYYGGGGGGGGPGDDNDPPPPYTRKAPGTGRKPQSWFGTQPQSSQQWRPGFFSGAAAGAAAGYAMGNRGSNRQQQQAQAGPSRWFGRATTNTAFGGSNMASSSTSSNPGPSSARYESSGFGGTRRR